MTKDKNNLFQKILSFFRSLFLNGIMIILPIALTVIIFHAAFKLIKNWLAPIQRFVLGHHVTFPHAEIILVILFVLIIGFVSKFFLLKGILHHFEALFAKFPLIHPVYSGIKQIVHALTDQDKMSFSTVVLAEFPMQKSYSIGFLTGRCSDELAPSKDKDYFNIFIPTTPNPTTGFFLILPQDNFLITDLTRQEAMSLIISGGLVQPGRFRQ